MVRFLFANDLTVRILGNFLKEELMRERRLLRPFTAK